MKSENTIQKAFTGLLLAGAIASVGAADMKDKKRDAPKTNVKMGKCMGTNSCKGTGDCGGKDHACAGKNACKGQGWKKMSKEACDAQKGKFEELSMKM